MRPKPAATPGGGTLAISTHAPEFDAAAAAAAGLPGPCQCTRLVVRDNGVGMDQGVRAHPFEPLFTTGRQGRDTGLGLATACGIVARNHGRILVESEKGRGTTIASDLPCPAPRPARRGIREEPGRWQRDPAAGGGRAPRAGHHGARGAGRRRRGRRADRPAGEGHRPARAGRARTGGAAARPARRLQGAVRFGLRTGGHRARWRTADGALLARVRSVFEGAGARAL